MPLHIRPWVAFAILLQGVKIDPAEEPGSPAAGLGKIIHQTLVFLTSVLIEITYHIS